MVRPVAAVLAAALLASACSTVDSGDLRTSGMRASIVVTAGRLDSAVVVSLSAGSLTSVELEGDDRLVASSGGKQAEFDQQTLPLIGEHSYTAVLPGVRKPGEEVVVELQRGSDDTPTRSVVALPARIEASAPGAAARSADLVVATNDAPGALRASWRGSCVAEGQYDVAEGEPLVIPAGYLRAAVPVSGQPAPPKLCPVTLTVTRRLQGSLGDEFDRGSIESRRSESLIVSSRP
jgi:hypothetical protein